MISKLVPFEVTYIMGLNCSLTTDGFGTILSDPQFHHLWTFLVVQLVKNPPAMWEIWVRFLGWEDPLEEAMETTQCDILAWRIPGKRSLAGYSPWGRRVGHNLATKQQLGYRQ